jgi:hypothetical protein
VYDKKFAAVKNDCALASVGLPKRETKIFSDEIVTGSKTGPQVNTPAKAPTDEDTAGTIDEKSFSTTATPGDN